MLYFLTLCETSFRCKIRRIKKPLRYFPMYEPLCSSLMGGGGGDFGKGKPSKPSLKFCLIIEWLHCALCGLSQGSCDSSETTAGERS